MSQLKIEDHISVVPDFPKPGIVFRDITPLLAIEGGLRKVSGDIFKTFVDLNPKEPLDYIAGLDARGFIIGGAMSVDFNTPLITVRKAGKLPPPVISVESEKEYGTDKVEVSANLNIEPGSTVAIVDDLLATGGTAIAAIQLLRKLKLNVMCASFVVELDIGGRNRIEEQGVVVTSLLKY